MQQLILTGVLVTHNRPHLACEVVQSCVDQTLTPNTFVVVDVGTDPFDPTALPLASRIHVIRTQKNLGPAGAIPLAAEYLATTSDIQNQLVVLLDDDDPFRDRQCVERAVRALLDAEAKLGGRRIAGVGHRGSVFDTRRMLTKRPEKLPTEAVVEVSSLHGGYCPVYRLAALLDLPDWVQTMFWGFEELGLGMHLRAQGWTLLSLEDDRVLGPEKSVRLHQHPRLLVESLPTLRRYYGLRNLISLQTRFGSSRIAVLQGALRGIAKPLLSIPIRPRAAWKALAYGTLAVVDGLARRHRFLGAPGAAPSVSTVFRTAFRLKGH
ncbi:MAG TPA: glycosyltransferase [Gemmatimonadaceae bacterium]|nr:glycosyltransferase [Gemmatimonadaceae bacterium]